MEGLEQLFQNNLIYYIKWIMVSVSILYLSLYGFMYITSSGKEENISEQHDNFIWALIGFAVVGISNLATDIFSGLNPTAEKKGLINQVAFDSGAMRVVNFIEYMLGSVAVLYTLLAAIRLIMAGGDESIIDKEKKNFTWGLFGIIIVMIADTFIKVIYNRNTGRFSGEKGTEQFTDQLFGVINFILGIMSAVGVLTIVIAGIYYVTAIGDTESTEKAIKIIKSTVIGFIIMSIAYALVYTFAR